MSFLKNNPVSGKHSAGVPEQPQNKYFVTERPKAAKPHATQGAGPVMPEAHSEPPKAASPGAQAPAEGPLWYLMDWCAEELSEGPKAPKHGGASGALSKALSPAEAQLTMKIPKPQMSEAPRRTSVEAVTECLGNIALIDVVRDTVAFPAPASIVLAERSGALREGTEACSSPEALAWTEYNAWVLKALAPEDAEAPPPARAVTQGDPRFANFDLPLMVNPFAPFDHLFGAEPDAHSPVDPAAPPPPPTTLPPNPPPASPDAVWNATLEICRG